MQLRSTIHATLVLAAGACAALNAPSAAAQAIQAQNDERFTVSNIRIEGLQRISEGTVYNYLPVNIGDRLDERKVAEALKQLFATGFFRDVEMRREGTTLVIAVLERPSIESFEIKGNKDIKTEELEKSLRNVGLATGKTFDQSVLDDVKRSLTDQYYSRGKYAVRVDTKVDEVPGNKVKVSINIKEGKRAKIREINIAGNHAFSDKELRDKFELKTPNWLSWYKQDDRYSRESLSGDQEKLRSYYMDRGYVNFQIDSTQVAIAPEKDDIFVTINVTEGEVYKISELKIAGNLVVPESELKKLIFIEPGATYSRQLITASTEAMNQRMGLDGYAFSKVDPVPQINEQTKEVSITFVVDPGNRVYVRRVNFNGTSSVNDEVFRREMRQLEGAYLSNSAVERSKQRIQSRLPFIEKVEAKTDKVPGTNDLVDVNFDLKEGLPGQFGGGVGYSESQSLILNGNFTHTNFMGTGSRIQAEIDSGRFAKSYLFSKTDPYTTIDGVARTFSLTYRDITQFTSAASDFSTKTGAAALSYAYPISEFQTLNFGATLQHAELLASQGVSAPEAVDWVRQNGHSRVTDAFQACDVNLVCTTYNTFTTRFNTYELNLGWSYESRNRAIFADRGMRHRFNVSYTVPGSEVEYWIASYDYLQFIPIWRKFTLMFNAQVAYGDSLGDTTALPPFRQFFAGGPESVRGYRENRLGPKDGNGNPYGGNLLTVAQTELLLPIPDKWRNSARFSLFFDIGNVFSNGSNVKFVGVDRTTPVDYKFSYNNLKQSTGIAVQWLAPLGVFRFSYAIPLNKKNGTDVLYKDETEGFQFSIGQAF